SGSDFDSFLEEEGILEEVSAKAHKRLLALQLGDIMRESSISKTGLAERLHATTDQVDLLLDPENTAITLENLERLARAVGRQLRVEFA
ncbi:MAG: XRE family transcriptional regulator, partial [bacterium]|nr:XRE family transcriptional regulator [bacterium]